MRYIGKRSIRIKCYNCRPTTDVDGANDRVAGGVDNRNDPALAGHVDKRTIGTDGSSVCGLPPDRNGRDDGIVRRVDDRNGVVALVRHVEKFAHAEPRSRPQGRNAPATGLFF